MNQFLTLGCPFDGQDVVGRSHVPSLEQPMIDKDFQQASGLIWLTGYLRGNGPDFVTDLEDGFKSRAKSLQRALSELDSKQSPRLMQVQEALAKALGFPNTHAFQQAALQVKTGLGTHEAAWETWLDSNASSVEALVPLYLVLRDFTGNTPLEDFLATRLERVAASVAMHLCRPADHVKDAVAQAWGNAEGWTRLFTRTPMDAPLTEPLVTFEVQGPPTSRKAEGYFTYSEAAHWIWDNELGSDPDERTSQTPDQEFVAYQNARGLASTYPTLLPAWAAASNLMVDNHEEWGRPWSQALKLLTEGLAHAQRLMPKGFKGTLSWYHHDNRSYLRSLHQMMTLELNTSYFLAWRRATQYANKMLRLCPDDNMGVRCKHPALLAVTVGDTPSMRKAVARALKTGGPSGELHAGIALIKLGDDTGVQHLISAIFQVPEFGALLLEDKTIRPYKRFDNRPFGYEDVVDEALVARRVLDDFEHLGDRLRLMLKDPDLLREEARLEEQIGTRETGLNWAEWHDALPAAVQRLSDLLVARYPAHLFPPD